jgi:hypothetical protein
LNTGVRLALTPSGIIYVAGRTNSTNFPVTQNAFQPGCGTDGLCNGGNYDAFVTGILPQTVFDALNDFSLTNNPNGSWSYGYAQTPTSAFHLFTLRDTKTSAGLQLWADCYPFTSCFLDLGLVSGYPVLYMHPGKSGTNSVLRFTAPTGGTYSLTGYFEGLDAHGTTTNVAVTVNKIQIFGANILSSYAPAPFSWSGSLKSGDIVDFTVGYGPDKNYLYDATGVSATFQLE